MQYLRLRYAISPAEICKISGEICKISGEICNISG
jgi:hypothetical protein